MTKATAIAATLIATALLILMPASMALADAMEHRADLDWAITMGDTDTALNLLWSYPVLANAVVNPSTKSFPLHECAARNEIDVLKKLLTMKVSLDVTDMNGDTPLHRAASNGHRKAVTLLIEAGAKTGMQNNAGKTPAMLALDNGNDEIAQMLSSGGQGSTFTPPPAAADEPMAQEPMAQEAEGEPLAQEPVAQEPLRSEPLRLVDTGGVVLEPVTFKNQAEQTEPVVVQQKKPAEKKPAAAAAKPAYKAETRWPEKSPSGKLSIKALSGDGGMLSVRKVEEQLKGLGYKVERVDVAPFKFKTLTVFYNKGYKIEAEEMAAKIKARVRPMTWESVFDIIVVSGNPVPPLK